jgi:hypothetical protein
MTQNFTGLMAARTALVTGGTGIIRESGNPAVDAFAADVSCHQTPHRRRAGAHLRRQQPQLQPVHRAAKVPASTVHGTRKTCGSLLAGLDVHPRVATQILRHSKTAVAMEIYIEVPSAATREALGQLGQQLGSDT